jgi:hypothetical protein
MAVVWNRSAKEAARLARLESVRVDALSAEARAKVEATAPPAPKVDASSDAIYAAVQKARLCGQALVGAAVRERRQAP